MKVSELIAELQKVMAEHGDIGCHDFDHLEVQTLPDGYGAPGKFISFYQRDTPESDG